MMLIRRSSRLTGIVRELNIDIKPEDYAKWYRGANIQDAAPHLSADDREFIISGITPDEWTSAFGVEE